MIKFPNGDFVIYFSKNLKIENRFKNDPEFGPISLIKHKGVVYYGTFNLKLNTKTKLINYEVLNYFDLIDDKEDNFSKFI